MNTENLGLTTDEAQTRKKNRSTQRNTKSYAQIIISNTCTLFNIVLVAIALVYLGVYFFFNVEALGALNNYTFLVVLFFNSLISIISEIQSKRTLEKMNIITTATYRVIRDHNEIELPSDELVVGDHLYLTLGNQVPVDGVIVDGVAEFNESLLTGESDAVKKTTGDKVYAGSYVISGNVLIEAENVADDRYASKI